MYNLLFWVGIQLLLLWLLAWVTLTYRNRRLFKLLFFPSVVLEGLLRILACALSATRVKQISFFEDRRPFITEDRSRIPYFGPMIFLLVWLVVLFTGFYLWATTEPLLNAHAVALPHVDPDALSRGLVHIDSRAYLRELSTLVASTPWQFWQVWFFGYVIIGSFPFFALNFRQVQQGFLLIVIVAILTAAISYLGVRPGFLSRGWYIAHWVLPECFRVYSFFVTLLALCVALHLVTRLFWEGLQALVLRTRASRRRSPERPPDRKLAHTRS